jgi:hypothetical protein
MNPTPSGSGAASDPLAPASELELHTSVEALQVQVRALATAIDHLCRALEASASEPPLPPEAAGALEEARWSLGEIW